MLYKTTTKLFLGKYSYKVVLAVPGAQYFRSNRLDSTLDQLKRIDVKTGTMSGNYYVSSSIKTDEDLKYAFKLHEFLSNITDYTLRVESPWISFYTSTKQDVDKLVKLSNSRVKYVCKPDSNINLTANTVILPKINYEFRVVLGKTTQEHSTFIKWAETNNKVKLTKSCVQALSRSRSWGGTYFYITGNNNLLLAKMHLGGSISKVEQIIKA
jgi:hypothetical protein